MARKLALATGSITTVAAGGAVFSLRNASTTQTLLLRSMVLTFNTTTAFTTPQIMEFMLYKVTAFTSDATGGTVIDLTTSIGMLETGTTAWPNTVTCRIATTGALGNGTRTPETQPIGCACAWSGGAGSTITRYEILGDYPRRADFPIRLLANEGVQLQVGTTMGAAGVGKLIVDLEAELV